MKYKLNIKRDVDVDGYDDTVSYILNLPYGFRFDEDGNHVKGYDSMKELRADLKYIEKCGCKECETHLNKKPVQFKYNAPVNPMFLGAQPARNGQDY